ncbi:hypothetical protein [Nannocystis radixulma]|uniref:Uncharacterized protein n=1 Tax=Nannocystis radixulma TaxID=2995305 RepID=A0ABT5BFV7_9BACT|nr:hypothetical protein [Nannocystis radixulma]MDC0673035.1 hypothetical protein [Nannocystis radixulma]
MPVASTNIVLPSGAALDDPEDLAPRCDLPRRCAAITVPGRGGTARKELAATQATEHATCRVTHRDHRADHVLLIQVATALLAGARGHASDGACHLPRRRTAITVPTTCS